MNAIDKQLSDLLASNSDLLLKALKELAKESKVPGAEREPASQRRCAAAHLPYVNATTITCSLCGSSTNTRFVMTYDTELRGYKISHSLLPSAPADGLLVHRVDLVTESCTACPSILINYTKEELIELLVSKTKRDKRYFDSLQKIARRVVEN